MNKSTAGKKRIVIVAAFVILIVVMAAMFMIVRYTPTKEKMNGYVFFNLDKSTDKTMVIIDGKQYSDTGVVTDGRHYLPQEFVADNINAGFYYDKESQAVLYSDSSYTLSQNGHCCIIPPPFILISTSKLSHYRFEQMLLIPSSFAHMYHHQFLHWHTVA